MTQFDGGVLTLVLKGFGTGYSAVSNGGLLPDKRFF